MTGSSPASSSASSAAAPPASRATGALLLTLGVVSVGAAAILIRLADAPALAVSFWRTLLGGAALFVVVRVLRRPLPRGEHLQRAIAAGVLLGVHFWLWIESLDHTSVAASVVLVCLQPVFVVILARVFLGEATAPLVLAGILVALGGTGFIALDGAAGVTEAPALAYAGELFGDLLALGGAVAIAVYVLVGRKSAGKVDVLAYSTTVSLVAAASLLLPLLAFSGPLPEGALPPSTASWLWVLALALGPQLVGHTALNAALGRLPAAVVSGAILGEPIIATALAWVFLDEKPGALTLAGSGVILVGLAFIVRGTRR